MSQSVIPTDTVPVLTEDDQTYVLVHRFKHDERRGDESKCSHDSEKGHRERDVGQRLEAFRRCSNAHVNSLPQSLLSP